jgi:hypothetical protein
MGVLDSFVETVKVKKKYLGYNNNNPNAPFKLSSSVFGCSWWAIVTA